MPLIEWKDEFKLGISEIDAQHQRILALINELYAMVDEKKYTENNQMDHVIQELADYAIYHFSTEEKYFQLFGYEKKDEHIKIHEQYKAKIEEWRQRYNQDKNPAIFFEISEFLQNWWTWHINNTDRAYVPFLQANGVK
ncbi:MAG: bacteriohemerythrin [Patescibacteria group bacterium]|nr:bacteriohemerythrin [Patescibacteria group bacterium]